MNFSGTEGRFAWIAEPGTECLAGFEGQTPHVAASYRRVVTSVVPTAQIVAQPLDGCQWFGIKSVSSGHIFAASECVANVAGFAY